jgi:hypothetical protein
LNILFQHHENNGTITSYKGKFVMAFFDVACWEKGARDITKYNQYSTEISVLKSRELGFGGPVDLMNIPSLGASLNESNELVYLQKEERKKVNKHEKDKRPMFGLMLRQEVANLDREEDKHAAEVRSAKAAIDKRKIEAAGKSEYVNNSKEYIKHQIGAEQSAEVVQDRGHVIVHAYIQKHDFPKNHIVRIPIKKKGIAGEAVLDDTPPPEPLKEEMDVVKKLFSRVMHELTTSIKAKARAKVARKAVVKAQKLDLLYDDLALLQKIDRSGPRTNRIKSADMVPSAESEEPAILEEFEKWFLMKNENHSQLLDRNSQ